MNNLLIADTPATVAAYSLLTLKGALKLETLGMKGRVSAAKSVREILRNNGVEPKVNKGELLAQYIEFLKSQGILK